jgi:hypothetical protein
MISYSFKSSAISNDCFTSTAIFQANREWGDIPVLVISNDMIASDKKHSSVTACCMRMLHTKPCHWLCAHIIEGVG